MVAFTWNITTVEGRQGVKGMLDATLATTQPRGWRVTEEPTGADGVIEAWVEFETKAGRGQGVLRLIEGKAWTLLTTLDELKGYEQSAGFTRPKGVAPRRRPRAAVVAGGAHTRGRGARL